MNKCLLISLLLLSKIAFSQLTENFADGEFTREWKGDLSHFQINSVNQLQSKSHSSAQTITLATANSFAANAVWEFYIKLGFDPSVNNQVRIYLVSDHDNFKEPLNGYFIQIGESGAEDSYDLYRQTGTSIFKIIDGNPTARTSANQLSARIRVTRDADGKWELFTDASGGTDFMSEGTAMDITHSATRWFGVRCAYTVTNSDKFFFDDFTISRLSVDNIPPKLISARATDSLTIEVTFDELVDTQTATAAQSYSISPAAGGFSPEATQNPKAYRLKLMKSLETAVYTLSVSGIKDISGNLIGSDNSATFQFVKPYVARRNDVVFNEIFADPNPQVDLPSVEFVELRNTTNETITLKGWKYSDATSTFTFASDSIRPNELIILCAKADTAEFTQFGRVIGISPWPSLNNTGDHLKLLNQFGAVVDELDYNDSWYQDAGKRSGGWSLERVDPLSRCQGPAIWMASRDTSGGTPGRVNSVYVKDYDLLELRADSLQVTADTTLLLYFNKPLDPATILPDSFGLVPASGTVAVSALNNQQVRLIFSRKFAPATAYTLNIQALADCSGNPITGQPLSFSIPALPPPPPPRADTARILITEIFADPSPEVGLPLAEFVEIYNPGTDTVDLDGWSLNDPSVKSTLHKSAILPGEYLILCRAADTTLFQPFGKTLGISPWPSLNNAADQIVLKSFTGRTVDSIAYADTWYQDAGKRAGGWSLERVDPLSRCQGPAIWMASSNTSGGTPGRVNSVYVKDYDLLELRADSLQVTADTTLLLYFNKPLDPATILPDSFGLVPASGTVAVSALNNQQVRLTFSRKFAPATSYTLNIQALADCSGNPITGQPLSFSIPALPPPPPPRADTASILITEIFADPSPEVGLPLAEFVEIYNPGTDTVDLAGWSLNDPSVKSTLHKSAILPGEYLILCRAADTTLFQPFGKTLGISPWPSLNNAADQIVLKSFTSRTVDSIAYADSWYQDAGKRAGGWSLERVEYNTACNGKHNWRASIDVSGGTPGKENSVLKKTIEPLKLVHAGMLDSLTIQLMFNRPLDSLAARLASNYNLNNGVGSPIFVHSNDNLEVHLTFLNPIRRGNNYRITASGIFDCAGSVISSTGNSVEFFYPHRIKKGDILINEILFNPRAGGADFVEIYNYSGHHLDLSELLLATTKGDSLATIKPVSNKPLIAAPGDYFVLTTDPENIQKEYRVETTSNFIKMASIPAFNNDAGTVVLTTGTDRIDQLNYHAKMHFGLIRDPKGVSLERSSFRRPANEPGNFRSAAASAGYATPGYQNSQFIEEVQSEREVFLTSRTFSPDNDGFEDLLELKYRFADAGWVANATIYTDKGVPIKKVANNLTLAAEGVIVWDGLNERSQRPPVGIYVLYFEVFNEKGEVKRYRRSFALAQRLN